MIIAKDKMYGSFFFFFHSINREEIVWRGDILIRFFYLYRDKRSSHSCKLINETLNFHKIKTKGT